MSIPPPRSDLPSLTVDRPLARVAPRMMLMTHQAIIIILRAAVTVHAGAATAVGCTLWTMSMDLAACVEADS